jgi:predicted nucleotidyltransferase
VLGFGFARAVDVDRRWGSGRGKRIRKETGKPKDKNSHERECRISECGRGWKRVDVRSDETTKVGVKQNIIREEVLMSQNIQAILQELKNGLTEIFGESLKAVILFGSYARGDAHPPDSDIDVMIVLKGEFNYWEVSKRASEFIASLSLKNDVVVSRKFVSEKDYADSGMPLYINVRKEGLLV